MSNERADEFSGWAGKLEEPGALAGLGPGMTDKEAGWDKLYARLGRPRRRRPIWYWVAAASILLLAVPAVFTHDGHRNIQTPETPVTATNPPSSASESKSELLISKPAPAMAVKPKLPGRQTPPAAIPRPAPAILPTATTTTAADSAIHHIEASPSLLATGPATPIPQKSLFKKELKVISINEIQSPEQLGEMAGQKNQRGNFQVRLGNPGTYRQAMATSQPAERSGVHIKLSSQNP